MSNNNSNRKSSVRLASTDADYARLGLDRTEIKQWEDGMRVNPAIGNFEWWYFDAHLDDGSTLVVGFYTKPPLGLEMALLPVVTINLTLKDGRVFDKKLPLSPEAFSASKDHCDVRIGDNHFTGNLHQYSINAVIDDISVQLQLEGEVPSWRPHTGISFFEKDGEERYFAWFPSVPQGKVKVSYSIGDEKFETTGTGYHDHNWGDAPIGKLIQNWYWARAKVGPYTIIDCYITATEKYGKQAVTNFLIADGDNIIVDDERNVRFEADRITKDEQTGIDIAGITRYIYKDDKQHYIVTYDIKDIILREKMEEGFPGYYLRFSGNVSVEKLENDKVVDRQDSPALWELMYYL